MRSALIEALTTDYPGLMADGGSGDFDHMARAYVSAHPSAPSVDTLVRKDVADFLGATPPYSRTPAAAEMARFEWALGETFDSPDATPVTADALVALPPEAWETLAFTPLPSLRRLTLEFDVPQAWQRRKEVEPGNLRSNAPPGPCAGRSGGPSWVSNFRSLDEDDAALLDALADGRTFPELCEAIAPYRRGAGARPPASLLRAWVEGGLFAGFRR